MTSSEWHILSVAICIATGTSCGAVALVVAARRLQPPLEPGRLTRLVLAPVRVGWFPKADRVLDPPEWSREFVARLSEPDRVGLPLDVLAAAAVLLARAERASAASVRLAVFVCCADAAVYRLLNSADRDMLFLFVATHQRRLALLADLMVPLLEESLRRRGDLVLLHALLEIHYDRRRFTAIVAAADAYEVLINEAWQQVERSARPATLKAAMAVTELVAAGYVGADHFVAGDCEARLIWLLRRVHEHYVPNTAVGRFLCSNLAACRNRDAVARAIEQLPAPAWDDFSHLQHVFVMRTWSLLHPLLKVPGVVTELDRFVTERHRRAFWKQFHERSAS